MPGDLQNSPYIEVKEAGVGLPAENLRSRPAVAVSPRFLRHGNSSLEQIGGSDNSLNNNSHLNNNLNNLNSNNNSNNNVNSINSINGISNLSKSGGGGGGGGGGDDLFRLDPKGEASRDEKQFSVFSPRSFQLGVSPYCWSEKQNQNVLFGFNGSEIKRVIQNSEDFFYEFWRRSQKGFNEPLQRLYPVLAVLQWWFFNVLLVLLNKWIFQIYGFNFPLTLTAIHFMMSFFGAFVCIRVLHLKPLAKVTYSDLLRRVLPMAIVTNLNVCLGNVSLRYIPVTFMQTVKAFTPAATVALQALIMRKSFDIRVYIALIPVVGGVTLASATELSFHMFGFLAALTSTIFTSANSIMAEVLLKGHVDMDSINTVYYMAPQIVLMLTPLAFFCEWEAVQMWYGLEGDRTQVFIVIGISGILAFGLNFSLFYAIQATSAMTFNVAGNLKVAVAMLLGWLIYQNPMSVFSSFGCFITVVGCTWYGYIQHQVKMEEMQKYHALSSLTIAP